MDREQRGARWFRRGVKLALVLVALTFGVWLWPPPSVSVKTIPVQRGVVEEFVPSSQAGLLKAAREVQIRAVTGGRLTVLKIDKGARVTERQLLLELDQTSLQARLRLAQGNQAVGQSAARSAQLRMETARAALERNKKLEAQGALSPAALERLQAEYDIAREALSSAEANLTQLKAGVEVAQAALDEARVKAPFPGLVSNVHVELGDVVAPGAPLLDLVDDSAIRVEAPVDEADLGKLKLGLPVRVETDAYPDHPVPGTLAYISPVVLRDVRQNKNLNVEVSLNGGAAALRVGMSADLEIVVDRREEALYVPTSAVIRKGDLRHVWVMADGKAALRPIRVGLVNWDRTEVLEGLREGEPVITSLEASGLAEGARVTPERPLKPGTVGMR